MSRHHSIATAEPYPIGAKIALPTSRLHMSHYRESIHLNPMNALWLCGSIFLLNKYLRALQQIPAMTLCFNMRTGVRSGHRKILFKRKIEPQSHGVLPFEAASSLAMATMGGDGRSSRRAKSTLVAHVRDIGPS